MSVLYKYSRNSIPGGYDIITNVRADLAVPNTMLSAEIESAFPDKNFHIKINEVIASIQFDLALDDAEEATLDKIIEDHKAYFNELIEDVEISTLYFKVKLAELSDAILEKSIDKCPLTAPRSNDGYVMLKYKDNNVPAFFIKKNYTPYLLADVQIELQKSKWDAGAVPLVTTHSIKLDGINKYLDLGDEHGLSMTEAWTWSIWLKPQNLAALRAVLTKSGSAPAVRGFILYHNIGGEIYLQVRTTSINTSITFNGTLTDSVWNHLTISNSGSGLLSGLRLHIDGVWDGKTHASTNVSAGYGAVSNTQLGTRDGFAFFSGNFSSTTVWDKQLSDEEVTELYNTGSPANPKQVTFSDSLVSSWAFSDTGTFPILEDGEKFAEGTAVNVELGDYQESTP